MLNKTVKKLISKQISRYATVQSVEISQGFSSIKLVVLLNGDHSPIEIDFLEIVFADDRIYPKQIKASREWIGNLLTDHKEKIAIKLPKRIVKLFVKEIK